MMKKIDHAEWGGSFLNIIHEEVKDQIDNFKVDLVRGGIIWPAANNPGYICIVGQLPNFNKARKKPLILLAEHVCDLPQKLIETISAETRRMICRAYYSDSNEYTWSLEEKLDNYLKKFALGKITLDPPYLKDWITGILSIQQWWGVDDAIKLPEGSILRQQLGSMSDLDRDEARRGPLFAVDAFRTVLGSFELPIAQPIVIKKSAYVY